MSSAGVALLCYLLGQVDKWYLLKNWIILEQKKENLESNLEYATDALGKLKSKNENVSKKSEHAPTKSISSIWSKPDSLENLSRYE